MVFWEEHTQREDTGEHHSEQQQHEPHEELAPLTDGGEKGTASSTLPDLMQRRIHRRGCAGGYGEERRRIVCVALEIFASWGREVREDGIDGECSGLQSVNEGASSSSLSISPSCPQQLVWA